MTDGKNHMLTLLIPTIYNLFCPDLCLPGILRLILSCNVQSPSNLTTPSSCTNQYFHINNGTNNNGKNESLM